MLVDLTKLFFGNLYKIPVNEIFNVPDEYLENTDIKKIYDTKINGFISYDGEVLVLNAKISGVMILTCSRTLKEVKRPFDIEIEEEINENGDNSIENIQIIQNRVDIFPILWQYILMDVPLRVLAPDAENEVVQGEGWHLICEDEKKEAIDPRLECLNKFKE